jgi:hypothetical protein
MNKRILTVTLAAGVLAASNIATVQAEQTHSKMTSEGHVTSVAPVYTEPMMELQHAAQRLRETIQALAQQPPGPRREQAMSDARRALYEAQEAMIQLPPQYRVSGVVATDGQINRTQPVRDSAFEDAVKELQAAADRLRDSIQAMAQEPAGARRDAAIRQADKALLETKAAMAWVPGYPSRATTGNTDNAGSGMLAGNATNDAAPVQGHVPALSGGVGSGARAMLSSEAAPEHNMKMVFALESGNYLADVAMKVKDANGRTVIDGVSDGPWLYAKLPSGSYTATATYNGRTVTQHFTVGRSGQHVVYFRWPTSVERTSVAEVSPILGTGPENSR